MTIEERIDRILLRLSGAKSGKNYIKMKEYPYPLKTFIRKSKKVEINTIGDNYVTKISKPNNADGVVVYLHGGGYKDNFTREHWRFIDRLSSKCSFDVIAPDYPLLPQNYEQTIEFLNKVYENISGKYKTIIFMGDSAGGGLSMGYAAYLRDNGKRVPDKIIAFSPWIDLTMTNPQIYEYDRKDPMLNIEALRKNGLDYAYPSTPKNPIISPLYANLENLGEIYIFFGDCDLLCPDGIELSKKQFDGTKIKFDLKKNMLHAYAILPVKGAEYVFQKVLKILNKQASML